MEIKNLMEVNGKIECLKYLKKHKNKVFQDSARKIEKIIKNLPASIDYHLDFSDFPGFDYHSGLVFSVHAVGFGFSIAKGGQYISKQNDMVREAIGFDINVSSLTKLNK
jgi:ATP phosphoribosyltransferase regulatory subunit